MEKYLIIWFDEKTKRNVTKEFEAEDDEKAISRALVHHKHDIQALCRIPAQGVATLSNSMAIYTSVHGALRIPKPYIELINPEIPAIID